MPVSTLLMEGTLDGVVLNPVLAGNPTIETGCSKGSLGPRCLDQRRNGIPNVCYLRDRDYDYEPPPVLTEPIVDRVSAGVTLGWRWCRHEIENYLLESVPKGRSNVEFPGFFAGCPTFWNRLLESVPKGCQAANFGV